VRRLGLFNRQLLHNTRVPVCILLFFLFHAGMQCTAGRNHITDSEILKIKGFSDKTRIRLNPVILTVHEKISGIVGINRKNALVSMNRNGEFALVTISGDGNVSVRTILKGYPPFPGGAINSDPKSAIVWQERGRGIYFLDVDSRKTGHCNARPGDGNSILNEVFPVNEGRTIFLISVMATGHNGETATPYMLYDFNSNRVIHHSENGDLGLYPFNGELLVREWKKNRRGRMAYRWYMTDLTMSSTYQNPLTRTLHRIPGFMVFSPAHSLNPKSRMILGAGTQRIPGSDLQKDILYSIRWDEKMKKVSAEPFNSKLPDGGTISNQFFFSSDGEWVRTLGERTGCDASPELVMYHVNSRYPRHLSPPVSCGYVKNFSGVFMEHDTWGPCYIVQDTCYPEKLFVFRLREVIPYL